MIRTLQLWSPASTTGRSVIPALLTTFALLLTACAGPKVVPPSEEERNDMARAVLSEAIYTESLLSQCASVSPELKLYAQDLRTLWMDAHAEVLSGADNQLNRALAGEARDYAGHALALSAVRFKHEHQGRAERELRLNERSANNQRIVCQRRLDELEPTLTERRYLTPGSERDLLVRDALVADAERPVTMGEVPTLALEIPRNLAPGRSYREIERRMANTCPNAELVVIANEWPHEAYGIYCGQQSQSFIVCDWGECRAP